MSTGVTPSLGLLLGEDTATNENWQKLDRVYRALFRDIIPSSVVVQGDLEVTGNTKLDGSLEVVGPTTLDGNVTALGEFQAAHLQVTGTVSLPTWSLAGSALQPGTGIANAQTGTAQTGQLGLTATYQDLGDIVLSPADNQARWQLIIASLAFQIGMSGDNVGGLSQGLSLNLKRGQATTVVVQTRLANYTQTRAGFLELPLTMVRLAKPPVSDVPRWAIEGKLTAAPSQLLITRTFTQLSVVEFL